MAEITSPFNEKLFDATINDNGVITLNPDGGFINDETPLDEYNMNLLVKAILENKHNMESMDEYLYGGEIPDAGSLTMININSNSIDRDKAINRAAFGSEDIPTTEDSLQKQITANKTRLDELDNTYATDEELAQVSESLKSQLETEIENKVAEVKETIDNLDNTYATDEQLEDKAKYITGLDDIPTTGIYDDSNTKLREDISAINNALGFLADKDVIAKEPKFTFSSSNVTTVEVGTYITPEYTIAFDEGEYEYGPESTGSYAYAYEVTFDGESESLHTASGSFSNTVHVTDSTSLKLTAKCTYTDGVTPLNNLGLDYAAGKIVGAETTIEKTLTGYRQAFAGGSKLKDKAISELVSSDVRALDKKGNGKKTFDVKIDATAIRVLVAFPSNWGSLTRVLDVNDSNKNIVSAFGSAVDVNVSGATADEDMMNYKLYVMDFANAYGGEGNTYKVTIG